MLASPVAIRPSTERTLERPTRCGCSGAEVAAKGALTLVYSTPLTGLRAVAQPLSSTAMAQDAISFFIAGSSVVVLFAESGVGAQTGEQDNTSQAGHHLAQSR